MAAVMSESCSLVFQLIDCLIVLKDDFFQISCFFVVSYLSVNLLSQNKVAKCFTRVKQFKSSQKQQKTLKTQNYKD